MLHCLNRFRTKVYLASPGLGLESGSVHSSETSGINELFRNKGLTGMLETKDMDNTDNDSPFLGTIVDVYCGNENDDVTRICTSYVDTVG